MRHVRRRRRSARHPPAVPARLPLLAAVFISVTAFAQRPIVCCDYGGDKVCILSADGKIEWKVEAKHPQDCWRLPNGNILFAYQNGAKEVTKDKQVVWEYRQDLKVKNHVRIKQKDGKEIEKDLEENVLYIGPSIGFRAGNFWLTAGGGWNVTNRDDEAADFVGKLRVGVVF